MNIQAHRTPGYTGKREHYLSRLVNDAIPQGSFTHNTLCLSDDKLEELAAILVEFAEDVHNDIGINC